MIYDKNMSFLRRKIVLYAGEFCQLATDASCRIYATDPKNSCIHVLTSSGDFNYSIGPG